MAVDGLSSVCSGEWYLLQEVVAEIRPMELDELAQVCPCCIFYVLSSFSSHMVQNLVTMPQSPACGPTTGSL